MPIRVGALLNRWLASVAVQLGEAHYGAAGGSKEVGMGGTAVTVLLSKQWKLSQEGSDLEMMMSQAALGVNNDRGMFIFAKNTNVTSFIKKKKH